MGNNECTVTYSVYLRDEWLLYKKYTRRSILHKIANGHILMNHNLLHRLSYDNIFSTMELGELAVFMHNTQSTVLATVNLSVHHTVAVCLNDGS